MVKNSCEIFGIDVSKQMISENIECREKKYIPESLKKPGGGPIFIIDGGGPGGGAAIAGEIYAYLESGKKLPKAIVGSSIGAMIALYLQYESEKIPILKKGASAEEKIEYEINLRKSLMDGLKKLFDGDLSSHFEYIGIFKSMFGNNNKSESKASEFFTKGFIGVAPDIFKQSTLSKTHFDIGTAVSIDVKSNSNDESSIGYDTNNKSYIVYNEHIQSDIIDASAAHKGTYGKNIVGTTFRDGNYGDYIDSLSNDIVAGQKVVFFTSYEGKRPYDFSLLQQKTAIMEQNNSNINGLIGNKEKRFNFHQTTEIFNASLKEARKKYESK